MTSGPSCSVIELDGARLVPLERAACENLAAAIVAIPPWSVMDYSAEAMARFLTARDDGALRYAVETGGGVVGAVSIRSPWLRGPYLELLALLPEAQGQGIGGQILDWLEREAVSKGARNLWVCASSFNEWAIRFYRLHGFVPAAELPGLVADGYSEILLRKYPLS